MSVVNVRHLVKIYSSFELNNVSFSVNAGRITGFIGRNGAGKTTTIKSMIGLIHPNDGEIEYFGMPFTGNENEIKKRIGYSTGTIGWYPRKKICDIVNIIRRFYETWDDSEYRKYLELFDLDENKAPVELSEGMKVKLNLLLALSHRAEVLILDEPSSGLDPRARVEMKELLKNLHSMGKTIIISSHILSELSEMCNSIGIMNRGQLITAGKIEDVMQHFGGGQKLHIRVISEMEPAVRLLQEQAGVTVQSVRENEILVGYQGTEEQIGRLLQYMIQNQVIMTDFYREAGTLESLFMQLTGGGAQ